VNARSAEDGERIDGEVVSGSTVEMKGEAGLAEHGDPLVDPEVPLQDDWDHDIADAFTARRGRPFAVLAVEEHLRAESKADGVVNRANEPVIEEDEGPSESRPNPGLVAERQVGFRLEHVVRMIAGGLNGS